MKPRLFYTGVLILLAVLCVGNIHSATYYWVGGAGNWSDAAKWSLTSGGTGGAGVPGTLDDVIFNVNSFSTTNQTVTINIANANCRNMTWTGVSSRTPRMRSSSTANNLNIYGNLALESSVGWMTSTGFQVYFLGSGNHTITSTGKSFTRAVYFNGTGTYTLQDGFSCSSTINLNAGTLVTNNQTVGTSGFNSQPASCATVRVLDLGSSTLNLSGSWNVTMGGLSILPGTSTINITGTGSVYFYRCASAVESASLNVLNFTSTSGTRTFESNYSSPTARVNLTVQQLSFSAGAVINGQNTIGTLTLAPANTYTFQSSRTTFITNALQAPGSCAGSITMQSSSAGIRAVLSQAAGTVNMSYCNIKDFQFTGGATFTATNSTDLGNNTGVTIQSNAVGARTLYWVGGAGNWNSLANWSLSSGGAGGECPPSAVDDVIIDVNSFTGTNQTITINVPNADCRNMTWTGVSSRTPRMSSSSTANNLNIYGNLALESSVGWMTSTGFQVYFMGAGNHTITSTGKSFTRAVYFNGTGTYTLQDGFTCSSTINLNAGTLVTNNQTVGTSGFNSQPASCATVRVLDLGSSTLNLSGSWNVTMGGLSILPGTSTINVTGTGSVYFYRCASAVESASLNVLNFTSTSGTRTFESNYSSPTARVNLTVQQLSFSAGAVINGQNTIGTLVLAPANTYTFQSSRTTFITNALQAPGSCAGSITMNASSAGTRVLISQAGGTVNMNYCNIKDFEFTGGASFVANNSTDQGNNLGITINSGGGGVGRTLYWVGGAGNWNSLANWSLSSGGAGGECPPSSIDDVIIDVNSFTGTSQTITINVPNADCRNMTWTGVSSRTPRMSSSSTANNLNIYGNLALESSVGWMTSTGFQVYFMGTGNHTITSTGKSFTRAVYFNGTGTYTLQDGFSCSSTINLNAGTLVTNNQTVGTSGFNSQPASCATVRVLDLGSSTLNLSGSWNVTMGGLSILPGTSIINITGTGSVYFYRCASAVESASLNVLNFTSTSGTRTFESNYSSPTARVNLTVQQLSFSAGAVINGQNTIGTLVLAANNTYTFQSSRTTFFTQAVQFGGQCNGGVTINSSSAGLASVFSASSGVFSGVNLTMKDISGQGGATFNAYNSVDQGNNAGWNFSALPSLGNPGNISSVGNAYSIAPVQGAVNYTWTVPPGATLVSGQGTTQIQVSGANGQICVTADNGCGTSSTSSCINTGVVTINLGNNPFACTGDTSVTLSYSGTTGSPDKYSIDFDAAANAVGFTDVSLANLQAGQITIQVPLGVAAATYSGQLTAHNANTGITSVAYSIQVQVVASPTLTLTTPFQVCVGASSTSLAYTGLSGGGDMWSLDFIPTANSAGLVDVPLSSLTASPLNVTVPSNLALGGYDASFVIKNSSNQCQTSYPIQLVGNPTPTFTLGSSPSVVTGTTSANLTYTAGVGAPDRYSFTFDASGLAQGFSDVVSQVLPSSPIPLVIPSSGAAGVYPMDVVLSKASTGCASAATSITVTLNAPVPPTITLGSITSLCTGTTQASIPINGTTQFPDEYQIDFNAAANTAGLVDVSWASLPGGSIAVTVPSAIAAATYSGTLTVRNTTTGLSSSAMPISFTVHTTPTATANTSPFGSVGSAQLPVTYTLLTGSPNQYTLDFSAAANTAGFVDITNGALAGSPLQVSVPGGATQGNYAAQLQFINSSNGCASAPLPLQISLISGTAYYWVGGTGNWSNTARWSLTSGGAGGAGVPGANDVVFFDANSFTSPGQQVTLDVANASCWNMDWTGVTQFPTFRSSSSNNNLRVYGYLSFSSSMSISSFCNLYFEATSGSHALRFGGITLNTPVYFNGNGGTWVLQDGFSSTADLVHVYGTLNTNGTAVTTNRYSSYNTNPRTLILGSSTLTLTGAGSSFYIQQPNLTLQAGTSTIDLNFNQSYTNVQLLVQSVNAPMTFYNVTFSGTLHQGAEVFNSSSNPAHVFTFNNLSWGTNGILRGNTQIAGTLNLLAGKTYQFQNGTTHVLQGGISGSGSCGNNIVLRSTTAGSATTLSKSSGAITLNYVSLQDVSTTGGATFTANNSVVLSNVNGFTVNPPGNLTADYYWIGGTGNWSNPLKWSNTSGGVANAAGCIPGSTNRVYFDANSFTAPGQQVTIDVANAECKSMDWTGVTQYPTFRSSSSNNNLKVYEGMTWVSGMSISSFCNLYFEATSGSHPLRFGGLTLNTPVYLNGNGGTWVMQDGFTSTADLIHVYGTLNTNGTAVTTNRYSSYNTNTRTLILGNSTLTLTGAGSSFYIQQPNFTLQAGTSTIDLNFNQSYSNVQLLVQSVNAPMTFYNVTFSGNQHQGAEVFNSSSNPSHVFTFNNLSWGTNGILRGNTNIGGALTLLAGKTYQFQNGTTHVLSGGITGSGGCGNNIVLRSTTAGSAATLSKSSGSVVFNYTSLQDITATGGATFTANNSTVLSNVTGVTVNPPGNLTADYYWIGGTGNWSNPLKWSNTSGGTANAAGCVPGSSNRVYFDANSFSSPGQQVTIDVANAECKSMDWTGVTQYPTFRSSSSNNNLKVYEGLTWVSGMSISSFCNLYFEATSGSHPLRFGGLTLNTPVYFNGNGGTWVMQDGFTSTADLVHVYGTLNTNGTAVTTNRYSSYNTNPRTLILGNSTLTLTGAGSSFYIQQPNFTLQAGTSTIDLNFNQSYTNVQLLIQSVNAPMTFYNVTFSGTLHQGAEVFNSSSNPAHVFTFNNLSWGTNGILRGNTQISGNLTLLAGKTYQFQNGTTHVLNGGVTANGLIGQLVEIRSTTAGSTATFSKASGCVLMDRISLKDMIATGGANFYAGANSTNQGNNTGWSFTTPPGGNSAVSVAVSQQPSGTLCPGTSVTFIASATNEGVATYQWKKNGVNVGTSQTTYVDASLVQGDSVWVVVSSASPCVTNNPATSNTLGQSFSGTVSMGVTITPSLSGSVCSTTSLTFTAAVTNGGANPTYQWTVNGVAEGTNQATFTKASWVQGDQVMCTVTSNLGACLTSNPVSSAPYAVQVLGTAPVSVSIQTSPGTTITAGTPLTFTAQTTNGGANPSIVWKKGGVSVGTGATYSPAMPLNGDVYTCELTSNLGSCVTGNPATSAPVTMTVNGDYTFYWVGGSGNWSDGNKWALSSGGSPVGVVPGANEHVRFDANSGLTTSSKTVTINVAQAFCKDMDWTGATSTPILATTSSSNVLRVYGALTFIPAMTVSFNGTVQFESTMPGQTITLANKTLNNVNFNGTGGWVLQDPMTISGEMRLNSGSLNTNTQMVSMNRFVSQTSNARTLNMAGSYMTISYCCGNGFVIDNYSSNFSFNGAGSTLLLSGTSSPSVTLNGGNQGFQWGHISFSNPNTTGSWNNYASQVQQLQQITFIGHGNIRGNNAIAGVALAPGKTYQLESGRTQQLTGTFQATGGCGNNVVLQSTTAGSTATLQATAGTITANYITLRDITATGGATFQAIDATLVSNVSGWNVSSSGANNIPYYWVGGTGNWSDPSHWATTSGGAANPAGCIPGDGSDVYFDANSGFGPGNKTVTMDVSQASCLSMSWVGALQTPIFAASSPSNTLKIYGSLTLIPAMTFSYNGQVHFESSVSGQTITTANKTLSTVYFNGSGEWTLQDGFTLSGELRHQAGSLITNGQPVSANRWLSQTSSTRLLNCQNSQMTISYCCGNGFVFDDYSNNLTIQGTGSTWIFTGTSSPSFTCNGGNQSYVFGTIQGIDANTTFAVNNYTNVPLQISHVQWNGHGIVRGNNTLGQLSMTAGKTYQLESGRTQTITGNLVANGGCGNPVVIRSTSSGTAATLSKTTGTITLSYVSLQDLTATGGAVFQANDATVISNVQGFSFATGTGTTSAFYWIGGTGNWSDPLHWSATSGGPVNPNGCIPGLGNDVFFDASSGFTPSSKTVTIDVSQAACANMSWAGAGQNPIFNTTSSSNQLQVYGSLTLIPSMTFSFNGSLLLEGNTTHTLTTSGKTLSQIFLNGSGSYTLQDGLTVSGELRHNAGSLVTQGNPISMNRFISQTSTARQLNIANSNLSISYCCGNGMVIDNYSSNMTVSANGSTIQLTGTSSPSFTLNGGNQAFQWGDIQFIDPNTTGALNNYSSANQSFGSVYFTGNGVLRGNNTLQDLNLSAGRSYQLEQGRTQTITGGLFALGSSGQLIDLQSTSAGGQATLSKSSGCVVTNYVQMRDIVATGGAQYFAGPNSINLGNNSVNWVFNLPANMWFGFSQQWGNASNWNLGNALPDASTDVIITNCCNVPPVLANTVQTVQDLTIMSGAALSLEPTSELQIGGDFINHGQITGTGILTANGTTNQYFTSGGVNKPIPALKVQKATGLVILTDSLKITGSLNIVQGGLQLDSATETHALWLEGNFTNQGSFYPSATAPLIFSGNQAQSITTAGVGALQGLGAVLVDKSAGTLSLASDLRVGGTFTLQQGTVDFGTRRIIFEKDVMRQAGTFNATLATFDFAGIQGQQINTPLQVSRLLLNNATLPAGLTLADSLVVSDSLYLGGMMQLAASKPLVIGTSGLQTGTLGGTGRVFGTLRRWFPAATQPTPFLFPVGTQSRNTPVKLRFTGAPTAGTISTTFRPVIPITGGLPLIDGSQVISFIATEGFWEIDPGNGLNGGQYSITLTTDAFNSITDTSTFRVLKSSDHVQWTMEGTHGGIVDLGSGRYEISRHGLSGFSFFGGGGGSGPLPIDLISFTGECGVEEAILEWKTASEIQNRMFYIQELQDHQWVTLDSLPGAGFSNGLRKYTHTIPLRTEGPYYFRLVQEDVDGKMEAFTPISLDCDLTTSLGLSLSPNPSSDWVQVTWQGQWSNPTLWVEDMKGQVYLTQSMEQKQSTLLSVATWAPGVYLIRVKDDFGRMAVSRFIKY